MKCRICASASEFVFDTRLMNKHTVRYYRCPACGFMQTEEPFWLDEAYCEAIDVLDTGIMRRNQAYARFLTALLFHFFGSSGVFLDYAGGYGILARLMRDAGFDYRWCDPYCKNLLARGFEYESGERIDAVTALETFEHFVDPRPEIAKILSISRVLVFTTTLVPEGVSSDWWYITGQHVSFFSLRSLSLLATEFGLNLFTDNSTLHIFYDVSFVPRRIDRKTFEKEALKRIGDKKQRTLVRDCFEAKGRYYVLKDSGTHIEDVSRILISTGFTNRFIQRLLADSQSLFDEIVGYEMKSRANTDMELLKARLSGSSKATME
jgi:hypothetical protein